MTRRSICTVIGVLLLTSFHPPSAQAEFAWNTIDIHGFLSQGYLESNGNNIFAGTLDGTFQFNEVGLNFSTELSERLHVGLQLFARDLGDFGDNEIKVDWAYADYRWKDWLGFRAGRIKNASGLHLETLDFDMLRTYIFLPQSLYNESMRDFSIAVNGIGAYGYVPMGRMGDATYQLTYGAIGIAIDGTMSLYVESEANARLIDVTEKPMLRAHIEWMPPIDGLRITGSFMHTDLHFRYATTEATYWATEMGIPLGWEFPYITDDLINITGGVELARERLTFLAEYEYWETNVAQSAGDLGTQREAGYYAGLAYRLTGRWEVGAYYSVYYKNLNDRDGKYAEEQGLPRHYAWQKDWTLATRFDVNDHWLMKAEIHLIDGNVLLLNQHNPEGAERNSMLFALKTTYSF